MDSMVAYKCEAPAHRVGDDGPDKLTVHEGRWAFCPYDALADGHAWTPSEGVTLSMLQHHAAMRPGTGKDATPTDEQRTSQ